MSPQTGHVSKSKTGGRKHVKHVSTAHVFNAQLERKKARLKKETSEKVIASDMAPKPKVDFNTYSRPRILVLGDISPCSIAAAKTQENRYSGVGGFFNNLYDRAQENIFGRSTFSEATDKEFFKCLETVPYVTKLGFAERSAEIRSLSSNDYRNMMWRSIEAKDRVKLNSIKNTYY